PLHRYGIIFSAENGKDLAIDLQITSQLSCGTTIILMFPKVQYPVRRFDDANSRFVRKHQRKISLRLL
ncbi:MAG: hypothetical protein ACLTXW_05355, partial [Christensenellales bacterium]